MKKTFLYIFLIFISCEKEKNHLTDYVNPFIGTGGHGHTYPGASTPFGMIQLSPDSRLDGWDGCGGYHYTDSIIYGFSHTPKRNRSFRLWRRFAYANNRHIIFK